MGCLSLAWLEPLLIWIVVIVAVIAIVRWLIPMTAGLLGTWAGFIAQALNIVIGAIVTIALIVLVFDLLFRTVGMPHPRS